MKVIMKKNTWVGVIVKAKDFFRKYMHSFSICFSIASLLYISAASAGEGNTWLCSPPSYQGATPVEYDLKSWPSDIQRGVNLSPDYNTPNGDVMSRDDIEHLAMNWGVKHVRMQLFGLGVPSDFGGPTDNPTFTNYFSRVDQVLAWCREFNITVVLACHVAPGDINIITRTGTIWEEEALQTHLMNLWKMIADKYKADTTVIGYELLNEPEMENQVEGTLSDWNLSNNGLAKKLTDVVREVDTYHTLVIGGVNWSAPTGISCIFPTGDTNTIYTIHMYLPFEFTYQGLNGNPNNINYPGIINSTFYDKDGLKNILSDTLAFQRFHNLPQIYVGEFSVVNWAPSPSGYNYLKDLAEIFKEYGWSWAYHTYREEWLGFSLEYICPDNTTTSCSLSETDRLKLLESHFSEPTVSTMAVSAVTQTSAASGGNITCGASVTSRGVCWSTSAHPTTTNSTTTDGIGTGSFTSAITGLSAGTTYHIRAYAINSAGTAYGSDISFETSDASTLYVNSDGVCGGNNPCHKTIQAAIDAAATGTVILARQGDYTESLSLGSNKTLLIKGGYNSTYKQQTANTTIIQASGPTTIKPSSGSLKFQMINVK